jgi:serine/threonine protein kinase
MAHAADVGADSVALPAHPIGDFRIIREIGRGGMGVVYEAEQISLRRRVALKVLPFAAVLDPKHVTRFKNEAQAAANLDHPNIVSVYSVGCDRGIHYYAMQYVEGQSLAEVVEELRAGSKEEVGSACRAEPGNPVRSNYQGPARQAGPTSLDTQPIAALSTLHAPGSLLPAGTPREHFRHVARLGIQAAEALHYAHEMGIVHRDIKPSNLLVDAHGHLWITDFGLATTQTDAGLTMTGDILGTLRYMSPEQAAGDRPKIDYRTDIYSLGITLYELITQRAAFPGTERPILLRSIVEDDPPAPRRIRADIPIDLDTIVQRATSKEPADRYASMAEFAADLRCYLESRPIRAKRKSILQNVSKWMRRHHHVTISAAASALFLLALATGAWRREARLRIEADAQRDRAEANQRLAWDVTFNALNPLTEQIAYLPNAQILERKALDEAIRAYRPLAEQASQTDKDNLHAFAKLLLRRALNSHGAGRDMESDCLEAITIIQRLIAYYPNDLQLQSSLADAYRKQGAGLSAEARFREAADAYKNELRWLPPGEIDKFCPDLLVVESREYAIWALVESGRLNDATDLSREALRISELEGFTKDDPYREYWSALTRLSCSQLRNYYGDFEEAKRLVESGISSAEALFAERALVVWLPRCLGRGRIYLTEALVGLQRYDGVESVLEQAALDFDKAGGLEDRYFSALTWFQLGQHLASQGRKTEAAQSLTSARNQFEEIARQRPDEPLCVRGLILLLTMSPLDEFRNPDRALQLAEGLKVPLTGFYRRYLALAQYRSGRFADAIESIHAAMPPMRGGDSIDRFILAMAHWKSDNRDEAVRHFDEAVDRIARGDPRLYYHMGPFTTYQLWKETEQMIGTAGQNVDARAF